MAHPHSSTLPLPPVLSSLTMPRCRASPLSHPGLQSHPTFCCPQGDLSGRCLGSCQCPAQMAMNGVQSKVQLSVRKCHYRCSGTGVKPVLQPQHFVVHCSPTWSKNPCSPCLPCIRCLGDLLSSFFGIQLPVSHPPPAPRVLCALLPVTCLQGPSLGRR